MDGISGAAAVIGLVQVATQVTTALGRYVSRVKEAESSRAKLLEQIKWISAAEKMIETVLQNSPRSSRDPQLQALVDDWFRADAFPSKCKGDLEKLSHWLESQVKDRKRNKWGKMVVWPLKEDKIQATIRAFEAYMPYFQFIALIESLSVQQSIATGNTRNNVDVVKLKILQWLDGLDCTNKHENTREQRQKKTGEWLFKEQLYIDWRECSTKFFWLHGKAGAGKSVLASVVIDDLLGGRSDDEAFAYFYCDFRNPRCTSAAEVLRSLAKQLLSKSKNDWLSSFSDLTKREQQGAGPPTSLGTLSDLLKRAAELHVQPIFVIDALDECEDMQKLRGELVKLSHGHCRLFVTSRTLHTVKEAFAGLPSISLDERVDEVGNDMRSHIKMELESRSRLRIFRQDLKDEVEDALTRKAGGMFRWVQCQLDRLNECCSLGDVREALDTLPATLYETYDRMLRAIDKKPFGPSIARRALTWLVTALAPLKLSQLAEAMSISYDKLDWDVSTAPMHEYVILDILGSLVTVDRRNTITLSHYSVKEYLTSDTIAHSTYFVHRPNVSLELATVSIFSLMLASDESETTVEDGNGRLHLYAVYHGLKNLTDCSSDHNESLAKHLSTLQNHVSMHRLIYERHQWFEEWMLVKLQLALNIIIRLGHPALLRHYLDSHSVQATEEDNPLVFAALYSDIPRVQLLLDKGFDVNLEGPVYTSWHVHKMTPLTAAARNHTPENQESLVNLLLKNGCVVSRDAIYSILSCYFGALCKPAVVRILLEHGADPLWLGTDRRSCLHLCLSSRAASDDELETAQTLIAAGCDHPTIDSRGESPFQLAIQSLSIELSMWLLGRGFQLPSDAIPRAASSSHFHRGRGLLPMLEFLLTNGASAGARDVRGCNALHRFTGRIPFFDSESIEIESIVRLLVEHGCDINCRNDTGETPLHLAVASRWFKLHALNPFLAHGAELPIDIVNYAVQDFRYYSTPCEEEHRIATLSFLVKKLGASCRSQTAHGNNALHSLLKHSIKPEPARILEVVSLLVENGCDVHAPDSSGETPLQLAIENDYPVARGILAQFTELYTIDHTIPYHGDPEGNGILHRLCGRQNDQLEDKVRLLRETGYNVARDINRPNKKGLTPLCIALMRGSAIDDPAIVICLLNLGASFYHVNYLHRKSLEWASSLLWYRGATEAQGRCLSQSNITFDHVILVHHVLRVAHQGSISSTVARSILDMAEYWACIKVVRNNIRYTTRYSGEQISFPMVPRNTGCWMPRRLTFACKPAVSVTRTRDNYADICLRIRRADVVFGVPINLVPRCNTHDLPRVSFDVWDEFTPALQVNGRLRLMIGELVLGDMLSVEFIWTNDDYFTLEFFQIEVYYSFKPLTWATSEDL